MHVQDAPAASQIIAVRRRSELLLPEALGVLLRHDAARFFTSVVRPVQYSHRLMSIYPLLQSYIQEVQEDLAVGQDLFLEVKARVHLSDGPRVYLVGRYDVMQDLD